MLIISDRTIKKDTKVLAQDPGIIWLFLIHETRYYYTEPSQQRTNENVMYINFYADWIFTPEPDLWPTFFVRACTLIGVHTYGGPSQIVHIFSFNIFALILFLSDHSHSIFAHAVAAAADAVAILFPFALRFQLFRLIIKNERTIKWNVHSYVIEAPS